MSSDGTYYSVKAANTLISGDLEIPSEHSGLPVKAIDKAGFKSCSNLTSVVIPEGITTIPESGFQDCTGITSLTLPNGLKTLGTNSVRNCSSLTAIDIPVSVTNINMYVFRECSSITSIEIPASVTQIDGSVFGYCTELTSITVDSENKTFHSEGNCCIKTATNQLVFGCKTSVIPDYVTSILGYAFDRRPGLTTVKIPDGVTSIGLYAFNGCTGLTSVEIPIGVTSILAYAFRECTGLTYFKFNGDKVSEPSAVFESTPNLTSVHVNPFATGYGSTWGGKTVVVDNPVYLGGQRMCKAYYANERVRKLPKLEISEVA